MRRRAKLREGVDSGEVKCGGSGAVIGSSQGGWGWGENSSYFLSMENNRKIRTLSAVEL